MSDLFGNHIVGFSTRRLNYLKSKISGLLYSQMPRVTADVMSVLLDF